MDTTTGPDDHKADAAEGGEVGAESAAGSPVDSSGVGTGASVSSAGTAGPQQNVSSAAAYVVHSIGVPID